MKEEKTRRRNKEMGGNNEQTRRGNNERGKGDEQGEVRKQGQDTTGGGKGRGEVTEDQESRRNKEMRGEETMK